MRLLSQAPIRYVLLVVDDRDGTISTRLRRTPFEAELVAFTSNEAAASALLSGRRYSALIADRVDPDLARLAGRRGVPAITVGRAMTPEQLAATVGVVADPVPRADRLPQMGRAPWTDPLEESARAGGRLVAVCGPGGTGASLIAAVLASCSEAAMSGAGARGTEPACEWQGVRARPRRVLLADFALRADQSFLHGVEEPPMGLLDLLDAGRYRPISPADVSRCTVALGGGRLLPGLRREEHWTAVSPAGFDGMLSGLLGMFDLTVADITGELGGEAETGSLDVEERNHMARATARRADAVVAVGGPGAHRARRLAQLVDRLLDLGVDPARIQPVVNGVVAAAPTRPSTRQPGPRICGLPAPPIAVPFQPGADDALLPPDAAGPLAATVAGLLARMAAPDPLPAVVRVIPGSLGCAAP